MQRFRLYNILINIKSLNIFYGISLFILGCCFLWPMFYSILSTYIPLNDNDEVFYIGQIRSFTDHGFHGGKFSFENHSASIEWLHFGPHGPFFPILYGTLGKILGWSQASPYYFNLLLLFISFNILFRVLSNAGRAGLIIYFLTTGTVFVFLPSCMQECLALSIMMIIVAICYISLKESRLKNLIFYVIIIYVLSFARFTTVMLALIPIQEIIKRRVKNQFIIFLVSFVSSCLMMASIMLLISKTTDHSYTVLFNGNLIGYITGSAPIHFMGELRHYFSMSPFFRYDKLAHYFRCEYLSVMLVEIGLFLTPKYVKNYKYLKIAIFYSFLYLLLQCTFYQIDNYRDLRVLSPLLLIPIIFIFEAIESTRLNSSLVIYAIIALGIGLNTYTTISVIQGGGQYSFNQIERVNRFKIVTTRESFISSISKRYNLPVEMNLYISRGLTYDVLLSRFPNAPGLNIITDVNMFYGIESGILMIEDSKNIDENMLLEKFDKYQDPILPISYYFPKKWSAI